MKHTINFAAKRISHDKAAFTNALASEIEFDCSNVMSELNGFETVNVS